MFSQHSLAQGSSVLVTEKGEVSWSAGGPGTCSPDNAWLAVDDELHGTRGPSAPGLAG